MRADPGDLVEDDLLRLVLMCTHPALDPAAASALALRLVLGVSTADIARLFLVPEPTMAARLTRAKKKIVAAGIPFAVPSADVLPERLGVVAQTAYLAFTAGYAPGIGTGRACAPSWPGRRSGWCGSSLGLRPDEPVLVALLALMLLQHSRRDARVDEAGRHRPAARPGPLALAPRRGRRGGARCCARRVLTGPVDRPRRRVCRAGQDRGRARHGARRPQDTDWDRIVRALRRPAWRSPPRPAPGWPGRWRWPRRAGRGPGWPRSTGWTPSCRTATGCRRCGPSCSPGRASAEAAAAAYDARDRAVRQRRRARPPHASGRAALHDRGRGA